MCVDIVTVDWSFELKTPSIFRIDDPFQVNAKAGGKAALHCAAVTGNIPVLKALLEFNPNLEIEAREIITLMKVLLHTVPHQVQCQGCAHNILIHAQLMSNCMRFFCL